ncbi:MAG: DUF2520 domain-containing protein [Actinomycetaceae bacterium]|nr:DUF2520 domain-containing protein [Arcanobacterium sp.]MDD7504942.1 DUF2520 domain-containing protein [Actinomycetaceae bacterium]MDY6143288.1 DUF2520 domain-containing protein [Arcanobacterium sp.]
MNTTGRMGIGIISAGKVGVILGKALRAAGHQIIGAYASSPESRERLETILPGVPALSVQQIVERSEMVLLALPDDELAPLVEGLAKLGAWQSGQIVAHTAGRYGVSVLDSAREAGALPVAIHPAMTFTGTSIDSYRLQGCPFGVTATAPLLPIGHALVTEMGGMPFTIAESDRGVYHAALAHGANHLVTVVTQATRMLESIGIEQPGEFIRPLVHAAMEGALESGEALLTGPVVRGDSGTVAEHLHILREVAEADPSMADIAPSYTELAAATTRRAEARRVITASTAEEILKVLGKDSKS